MEPYDVRDLLRLSSIPGIGPQKFRSLIAHFGDPGSALSATPRQLVKVHGISRDLAVTITRHPGGREFAEEQLRGLERTGASILSLWDPSYPDLLKSIYDPPPLLFVLGALSSEDVRAFAIVGTRRPTRYGEVITGRFASDLVHAGATVVSGLARGVDTIAHTATLRAHGRTLAVLGSGLDVIYPRENRLLAERIANDGAVITEHPFGAQPDAVNFPRRNRIVSGLSLGTLVIQSGLDGGAMITASIALDQNREVYAVPGDVGEPLSAGPHALIRDGRAKLVSNVDDILQEVQGFHRSREHTTEVTPRPLPELTLFETAVFESLGNECVHIDDIADRSKLSAADTLVTLLGLEFKGLIRQKPGKLFERT